MKATAVIAMVLLVAMRIKAAPPLPATTFLTTPAHAVYHGDWEDRRYPIGFDVFSLVMYSFATGFFFRRPIRTLLVKFVALFIVLNILRALFWDASDSSALDYGRYGFMNIEPSGSTRGSIGSFFGAAYLFVYVLAAFAGYMVPWHGEHESREGYRPYGLLAGCARTYHVPVPEKEGHDMIHLVVKGEEKDPKHMEFTEPTWQGSMEDILAASGAVMGATLPIALTTLFRDPLFIWMSLAFAVPMLVVGWYYYYNEMYGKSRMLFFAISVVLYHIWVGISVTVFVGWNAYSRVPSAGTADELIAMLITRDTWEFMSALIGAAALALAASLYAIIEQADPNGGYEPLTKDADS